MTDIDIMSLMLMRAGIRFSRFPTTLELENDVVLTFTEDGKLIRIGSELTDAVADVVLAED